MEDSWWAIILIGVIIWLSIDNYHLKSDNKLLLNYSQDLETSLGAANDQITSLNEEIYTAQLTAWADYDSMGQALEDLQRYDHIPNPIAPTLYFKDNN